jgi:hypothetical protein
LSLLSGNERVRFRIRRSGSTERRIAVCSVPGHHERFGFEFAALDVEEVLDEVLHHAILLGHVTLKVNELAENVLIVGFHRSETGDHFIVTSGKVIDLALEGFEVADIFDGGSGEGWRGRGIDATSRVLASSRNLALDVLQSVTPVGVKVGMTECPTL